MAAFVLLAVGAPAGAVPGALDRPRLERTVNYLQQHQNADGGFGARVGSPSDDSITDDVAFALAAFGVNPRDQARPGGADVYGYMAGQSAGFTDTTDFDRALLVSNAAGADPHDFGGVDLVRELLSRQLPDGSLPHTKTGRAGGMNDTAFGLLGLVLVEEPGIDATTARMADWLEQIQRDSGGWGSGARGTDVSTDLTGAGLEALGAVGRRGGAAQAALRFLRARQNDDGGWSTDRRGTTSNTMSTAWVVQGLVAAGEDPAAWNATYADPLDYLASMQRADDGSIRYSAGDDFDTPIWTTAQVAPAFAGQPLPIRAVPRSVEPTEPPPGDGGAPAAPSASGVGGAGQGGTGAEQGDGVVAGGGGSGAPAFSRPQPQSRGNTDGGVRELDPGRTRKPAAATPTPAPGAAATATPAAGATPSGITRSNGDGAAGVAPEKTGGGDGTGAVTAVPSALPGGVGAAVTGRLIGQDAASGEGDGTAAAPGLLASKAGGPTSPAPAFVLAALLVAALATGWRVETTRPKAVRTP